MDKITEEKLSSHFRISEQALEKAKAAPENLDLENLQKDFVDMITRHLKETQRASGS